MYSGENHPISNLKVAQGLRSVMVTAVTERREFSTSVMGTDQRSGSEIVSAGWEYWRSDSVVFLQRRITMTGEVFDPNRLRLLGTMAGIYAVPMLFYILTLRRALRCCEAPSISARSLWVLLFP